MCGLKIPFDPNVLAGLAGSEDAGVYRLTEDLALIQTIDFFTPIVDDPRMFGRVAAANSLSDVYAMGGRPITAMNVVCFPISKLGNAVLKEILAGGLDILTEAGVALVGGHSVEDDEPKYGLSVAGLVHPDRLMTNSGLKPGDRLFLTKALGTGIIATALKGNLASEASVEAMVRSMCTLNRAASEAAASVGVRACTDITGFGLAGHVVEMARASHCRVSLDAKNVPVLQGALDYAAMGLIPGGAHANRKFFGSWITTAPGLVQETVDVIFDPQTSGGLVLGIEAARSGELREALIAAEVEVVAEIGEVQAPDTVGHVELT